jgi:micrococcal nuclease
VRHRTPLVAVALVVCLASACTALEDTQSLRPLLEIVDGDSLRVEIDGEIVSVRLLGINAPELDDCQGRAAQEALVDIVGDSAVEVSGQDLDRFGRLLGEVRVRDTDVNAEMVRQGWALAIHGSGDRLLRAAAQAASAGLGLWDPTAGDCHQPEGQIEVVKADINPDGPDDEHLNQELVVLANVGESAVDLENWILRDESTGNRLVLPAHELGAGIELTVHTGCGAATATDIYWCSDNPVWSNGGDTVFILGPGGAYVDHLVVKLVSDTCPDIRTGV